MSKRRKTKTKESKNPIIRLSKKMLIPGLQGTSIHQLISIVLKGLSHHIFAMRVGAVSWAFFFSLFPFLLFLFSILPYAPLYAEIKTLLFSEFIPRILPERITEEVVEYISATASGRGTKRVGSLFIILTILLSSNGIFVLINGFDTSQFEMGERRKGLKRRLISIVLTLFFVVFIIAQLIFAYYSNFAWQYIEENNDFMKVPNMIQFLNFLSASIFYFISLCMLYLYGTSVKQKFKHVTPGALVATVLFFTTLLAFQFYVKKLNYYDVLYGSVGLVMVMMVFIYINVLLIMVGFELNAAIHHAKGKNLE